MPKKAFGWTSSANVYWFGELDAAFRANCSAVLKVSLDDSAWNELQAVVRGYSMALSFEYSNPSLTEQIDRLKRARLICDSLISIMETLKSQELGRVLSSVVAESWESLRGLGAEYDRAELSIQSDIDSILKEAHLSGQITADDIVSRWKVSGWLAAPMPTDDLLLRLQEFSGALWHAEKRIKTELVSTSGASFEALVGHLDDWGSRHGIPLSVTKLDEYGHGTLTALVALIGRQIPLLTDGDGRRLAKQMCWPSVTEVSLAGKVIKARKAYRKRQKTEISEGGL